jgi:transcriptional regulator with XRE-family HTH domain
MDSIGEILRRARHERGLTLDEIASRTRINRKYLDAIERGDREAIPGGFFYKSFIRQYVDAVDDKDSHLADEIAGILASQEPVVPPQPDDHILKAMAANPPPERLSKSRNFSATTYLILLILALAGSSGLYMWWHRAQQAQGTVQAPPAPKPEQKAESPMAPQPVALSTPPPAGPGEIMLDVEAIEPTWFQVVSDGKTVFTGVINPGESKTFAVKDGARMKIGNAGGIEVKFNGRPIGTVGDRGQIRTVVFTPTGAEVVKPPPVD